jgi:hypothetical protein
MDIKNTKEGGLVILNKVWIVSLIYSDGDILYKLGGSETIGPTSILLRIIQ